MSSPVATPKRKLPIVPLVVLLVAAVVAAGLLLRGGDARGLIDRGRGLIDHGVLVIRNLGAGAFFAAMAVLPAIGLPLLAFTMTAGQAFAPQLGLGGVIALSLVAIAINMALGYWIARYALRPVVLGLMKRYGYSVPRVTGDTALTVTLVVRLTPGPPYFLQALILGVAEVPFRTYMIVSWLGILPWALGGIILGKGLLSGKFGVAATGFAVLIVAVVLVQWVRRRYFGRRPGPAPEAGGDAPRADLDVPGGN